MPEKIKFSKDLKINLFVTQSLSQKIIQLYKSELMCDVIGIPGGGLDTEIFYPKKNFMKEQLMLAIEPIMSRNILDIKKGSIYL